MPNSEKITTIALVAVCLKVLVQLISQEVYGILKILQWSNESILDHHFGKFMKVLLG